MRTLLTEDQTDLTEDVQLILGDCQSRYHLNRLRFNEKIDQKHCDYVYKHTHLENNAGHTQTYTHNNKYR